MSQTNQSQEIEEEEAIGGFRSLSAKSRVVTT